MRRRERERRQQSFNATRPAGSSNSNGRPNRSVSSHSPTKERLRSHLSSLFDEAEAAIQDIVLLEFGLSARPELEFELENFRLSPGASIWARTHGYLYGSETPLALLPTISIFVPELVEKPGRRTPEDSEDSEDSDDSERSEDSDYSDGSEDSGISEISTDSLEPAAVRIVKAISLGIGLEEYDTDQRMTCLPFKDRSDLFYCNFAFHFEKPGHRITWEPSYVYLPKQSKYGDKVYEAVDTYTWHRVGDSLCA
ncbi:hypothetical protein Hte_009840 [Hypoxylon texense]